METNRTEADAIRDIAIVAAGGFKVSPDSVPTVIMPAGHVFHDLEKTLQNPTRNRGKFESQDVQSFISYVKDFRQDGTRIYANIQESGASIVALLNGHSSTGNNLPGWGDHRAVYGCPQSVEWKRWINKNKQWFSQKDFAEFIEENVNDIVSPTGADMLEIAKTLHANVNVNFRSGVRLDNGDNQLNYERKTEATAGTKGDMLIPQTFTLGLKPFINGSGYEVETRLKYRIIEGSLNFLYEIVSSHKIIEAASSDIVLAIEKGTGLPVLRGTPPA